jgi:hypothetical protein
MGSKEKAMVHSIDRGSGGQIFSGIAKHKVRDREMDWGIKKRKINRQSG